jgi:phytoene dehydrogenase-like protein
VAAPARGSYDAVIVGGGHNGLVAAAYLARAGRSVLLLERLEVLGGAAISASPFAGVEARVSRYSYLVSLLPELIVSELALPLRLARRTVASYTPDPRVDGARGLLVDREDPAATAVSFSAVAGARAQAAFEGFYEMTRRAARAIFPTLTEPLRSRSELRALVGDDRAWHVLFEEPLAASLEGALGDELIAGVALTDGLIGTFSSADSPDLRQNRCLLYHVIGRCSGDWLVPVGGMGAVTEAIGDVARSAGAELLTGSEVLGIEPARESVEVRFSDGAAEHALRAQHVLVGTAPVELERLRGSGPEQAPPEGAQLKVNILLSRLPRLKDTAVTPERAFTGTFHVNETAVQLQQAFEQATRGELPSVVPCECYCHSLTDPSILAQGLRDAGTQTLTIFALHMPARLFAHDNEGMRAAALEATIRSLDAVLAEPIADCLLADRDGKPCVEAHTPLDLERELRMPGGHIFHRDLAWPFAEREQDVGTWGVETRHPRILLCGAGARRGGGVSGVPGRNAAMAVLA